MNPKGYEHLTFIINQLTKDELEDEEIATAFNIDPYHVRRLKKIRKKGLSRKKESGKKKISYRKKVSCRKKGSGRKSKIDKEKLIDMWKKNIPHDIIAKTFNIKTSTVRYFKHKHFPDVTRIQLCPDCGTGFETKRTNREVCDSCQFEHKIMYFNKKKWVKKVAMGTTLLEAQIDKAIDEEEKVLLRKLRKEEIMYKEREWWEY